MIATLGLLVWGYVVARLLQVPFEYEGQSSNARAWLVITSICGLLTATYALWDLFRAATRASSTMQGLGQ